MPARTADAAKDARTGMTQGRLNDRIRRGSALCLVLVMTAALGACVSPVRMPSPSEREPDRYLFERGTEMLKRHRWLDAREYFQRLVDQYPQSVYRQDARLGVGDSYIGEGGYDTLILASEKFREFLRFFPLNEKADYAQYRLGYSEYKQMLAPERDQTYTVNALKELTIFAQRYPNSQYLPEVLKLQREARDRLSDSELAVAIHYFRVRWYPGTITRLQSLLKLDPTFTRRDAAYYYLAEAFYKAGRPKEALPYFDKLIEEFKASDYLERANTRSVELKRSLDPEQASPPSVGGEDEALKS